MASLTTTADSSLTIAVEITSVTDACRGVMWVSLPRPAGTGACLEPAVDGLPRIVAQELQAKLLSRALTTLRGCRHGCPVVVTRRVV